MGDIIIVLLVFWVVGKLLKGVFEIGRAHV